MNKARVFRSTHCRASVSSSAAPLGWLAATPRATLVPISIWPEKPPPRAEGWHEATHSGQRWPRGHPEMAVGVARKPPLGAEGGLRATPRGPRGGRASPVGPLGVARKPPLGARGWRATTLGAGASRGHPQGLAGGPRPPLGPLGSHPQTLFFSIFFFKKKKKKKQTKF
jgi:hypothetical protein